MNYAFAVIEEGRCAARGANASEHFAQLRALKRKHPHLRTLISVGGWADSGPFSDAALTDASRQTFARSCADFVHDHGFDGVDIDWEYPGGGGADKTKGRPEDTKNFTLLLADLRRALDEQGKAEGNKHYLLTIAAPASPNQYRRMELGRIHKSLDWINLMTYDMAGEWSRLTDFHAPLYASDEHAEGGSADATVRGYLAAGVPPEKLLLGVPFYGRAWGGVKDVNHGLHQPHAAKPARPPGGGGGFAYRNLAANYLGKTAKRFWDDRAKAPWLFDEKAGVMIAYDDPQSLRLKAEYARDHHLGGVMIWELSEDNDRSTLLSAIGLSGRD